MAGFYGPQDTTERHASPTVALSPFCAASDQVNNRKSVGRMATDSTAMLFPLPEAQLPRVQIDPQTVADWTAEAQHCIASVMMDTSSWFYRFDQSHPGFTSSYNKNGTQGCMRVLPNTNTVEYLSQGELPMTLEDVVYAMYCETTQQQRAVHAQLYEDICLDSAILELYERATANDPFHRVAFLWTALCPKLSSGPMRWSLSAARDYLYFDFSCTTKDAQGRSVLVNYRKSQDVQLAQDHGLGINRRHTFGITTFCLHRSGRVVMTALGHIHLESKFTAIALKIILPVLYNRELNHMGLVAARNLQALGITADTLVEKNSAHASICRVCHKGFGILRKRKLCQGCGHAVCRDCNMTVALLRDGVQLAPCLPVVKARFCLRCLLHASEQRIKSELEHERMLADEQQTRVFWWESINMVDTSSVDGLLDLHRENMEIERDDANARPSAAATSSVSTADSGLEDEIGLDSTKTDEQVHVAALLAENVARLREKHQAAASSGTNAYGVCPQ